MSSWANKWRDIYIGSQQDVVGQSQQTTAFKYQAQQGEFELELPSERCYLINEDTTVEYLANHIAETLYRETPADQIKVKAYEGLGKGAIAERGKAFTGGVTGV